MDLQIDYNENQHYHHHQQPIFRNSISGENQNQNSCSTIDSNTKSTLYPELNSMTIEELRSFNKYSDVQLEQFLDDHNYKKLITNRKSATLTDIHQILGKYFIGQKILKIRNSMKGFLQIFNL